MTPSTSTSAPPAYCSACGGRLSPGDAFCSQCGREVGSNPAGPADADRAWLRRRVRDLEAAGWETEYDHGDRVVLRKRGFGSLPVHLLLFVFSGGVLNLLYALYRYTVGAPRHEVRADGTERSPDGRDGDALWTAVGVVAGVLSIGLLGAFALNGNLLTALVLLFVVFLPPLTLLGLPGERESLSTFGRERTVAEESVRNPPEPCTVCGDRIHTGVRRRYGDRLYAAGVPLRTYEEGENAYCRECAAETAAPTGADENEGERDRLVEF